MGNDVYNISLQEIDFVKEKMKHYCETKEKLHLSFQTKNLIVIRDPVVIDAVYAIFCIARPLDGNENNETFTLPYSDIARGVYTFDEFEIPFGAKKEKNRESKLSFSIDDLLFGNVSIENLFEGVLFSEEDDEY